MLQLVRHAGQVHVPEVEVQVQPHAVQRNGIHDKIGHVGGDGHIAVRARQQDVGQLLFAAHVRHGGTRGFNVSGKVSVQTHGHLQGVFVKKVSGAVRVTAHLQPDGKGTALAAQLVG